MRVATELAHMEKTRLGPDASDDEQDAVLAEVLEKALEAAEPSVERSPELLPVLREHGVVDAGGYGVTLLVAGIVAGAARRGSRAARGGAPRGAAAAARARSRATSRATATAPTSSSRAGTCERKSAYVARLEEIGDSVLVVGDRSAMRVHVHTDEPERAAALFEGAGTVERFDVADMHEQLEQRAARLAGDRNGSSPARPSTTLCGVVAVAAGDGMRRLYEQLGAHVVEGGATLNPSTFELLAGIHAVAGRGGDRAAQQRQRDHGRGPRRRAVGEGGGGRRVALAAGGARLPGRARLAGGPPSRTLCGCARRSTASASARSRRPRATTSGAASSAGDAVGFVDEEIVAWGDAGEHARGGASRGSATGREIITVISGEGAPLSDSEARRARPPTGSRSRPTRAASRTTGG